MLCYSSAEQGPFSAAAATCCCLSTGARQESINKKFVAYNQIMYNDWKCGIALKHTAPSHGFRWESRSRMCQSLGRDNAGKPQTGWNDGGRGLRAFNVGIVGE